MLPIPSTSDAAPALQTPATLNFALGGIVAARLQACREQWWLIAPAANPALTQMFRDRDRRPERNLLPWSGEFAGKYLTSAVYGWRLLRDPVLYTQIAAVADELIAAQTAEGYLGPFPQAKRFFGASYLDVIAQDIPLWDLWGHYHCMLGLLLWHELSGAQSALDACCKAADLLCTVFLDGGRRVLETGSEEMNMSVSHGLCLLHRITHNPRYLALVRAIEEDWQHPPAGDYLRQALAGVPFYQMPKPRWESLHAIQTLAELYWLTGDTQYRTAFTHIWNSIRAADRHNTGGFSSGEQATGNPYDPRAIETCCTVAWMALSVDMLRLTADPRVADELELSLFNGMLGGQSPTGRWWTYNTPMDGVKKASAHDIVFQARAGSPELNCCSVNAPRGLAQLADWAVMQDATGPVINFYGPGTVGFSLPDGASLHITQITHYPLDGHVRLELHLPDGTPRHMDLRLRIPHWSHATRVAINGVPVTPVQPGTYLSLARAWANGDIVDLHLDLALHTWIGERECAGKASLYRGPLLLAYDQRYNPVDPDELPVLNLSGLRAEQVPWSGPLAPWLLLQIADPQGQTLTLCDFANAGMMGTEYRTWLPISAPPPASTAALSEWDVPVPAQ